jgi:hypothetical protein
MTRTTLIAVVAIVSAVRGAHAEPPPVVPAIALGGTLSPAAFLLVDVAASPHSKTYGAAEIAVNGTFAIANAFLGVATKDECDCTVFDAIAVVDVLAAIHGAYIVLHHDEPPPLSFQFGRAHGAISPVSVSDGRTTGAGLGVAGRF